MEKFIIAGIGLIGVIIGSIITVLKEYLFYNKNKKNSAKVLVVKVILEMEKFGVKCLDVVCDDGTLEGEIPPDGLHKVRCQAPVLNFDSLDVDWSSIPINLISDILKIPNLSKNIENLIWSIYKYDDPPEYHSFFKERQYQYAKIGVLTFDIIANLSKEYKIPEIVYDAKWNPPKELKQRLENIESERN